jgi:dethiobiotin synthase
VFRGLFVTGTDTGVGKTAVSAALLVRYRARALRYWKPIQTGIEQDDDTEEAVRLAGAPRQHAFECGVRLPRPVSPHLAAQLAGMTIDIAPLVAAASAQPEGRWIVEGAGGALVPVNERETMVDLMTALRLPVIVAARSTLGTINHTLLTVDLLRRRAIEIAGVVMVGHPDADNRAAIEHYGGIAVVGEMPRFTPFTPGCLQEWASTAFDREGRLLQWLE